MRQYLKELESERLIKRLGDELGTSDLKARGIKFQVLLPRMAPPKNRTCSEITRGSESEPNKLKALKKDIKRAAASIDIKACLDCRGTGYWYPEGIQKGVTRCKHERLRK